MSKLHNNQSGFGAVEGILILIIVGMLGFVGWYVWHAKQNTDKSLTSNNSITPSYKKHSTDAGNKKAASTITTPNSNAASNSVFKIPELGIQIISVSSSINDLTDYKYASNSGVDSNNTTTKPVNFVGVQFSTQSLTNADSACSAKDGTSIGALARTDGVYVNNGPEDNTAFVKQFTGFYITYSHPESTCSNNASAEAMHVSQTATFEALVTNPANLQPL